MKIENLVLEESNLEEVIKRLEPYPFIEVRKGQHVEGYSFEYIEGMTYGFIWSIYDSDEGIDYTLLKEALIIHAEHELRDTFGEAVAIIQDEDSCEIKVDYDNHFLVITGSRTEKDGWES